MRNKQETHELLITELRYPNIGTGVSDGITIDIKNVIPGQAVEASVSKRKGRHIGRKLRTISESPMETAVEGASRCSDFEYCGGCAYQSISYKDELNIKEQMVLRLLGEAGYGEINYLGIIGADFIEGYRNKMEFSFGDESKDGKLALGMRKRESFYEVVTSRNCNIIDSDFKKILLTVLDYFEKSNLRFYHRMTKRGALRHLIIRKAFYTSEILINLVTTSELSSCPPELSAALQELELDGTIAGFLHTQNDSLSDAIYCDRMYSVFGRAYFIENLLGLSFRISPFSFFQTNSAGASELYSYVIDLVKHLNPQSILDLYCGTGTITQLVSRYTKSVTGVEIVAEAIEAAVQNARQNNITNCSFITGDVLNVMDKFHASSKPADLILVDPPRDGLHPKAIKKIIDFTPKAIIYISCKPTSLVRDLKILTEANYRIDSVKCFDLFPRTYHVESVVSMSLEY